MADAPEIYFGLEGHAVLVFERAAKTVKSSGASFEAYGHLGRALYAYCEARYVKTGIVMPREGLGIICFKLFTYLCGDDMTRWFAGKSKEEVAAKFLEAAEFARARNEPYGPPS